MNKVILISCVAKKLPYKTEAYKLYSPSTLFKAHWNYALKCLKGNPYKNIFILSALHGFISPFEKIEPYNVTLKKMSKQDKKLWAKRVNDMMRQHHINFKNSEFIILAGKDYYEELIPYLPNYKIIPEEPLPIGKRVQWFNNQIKKC